MTRSLVGKIIDGRAIASKLLDNLKARISSTKISPPGLAVIQVGNRQDSNVYIRNKTRSAAYVGINTQLCKLDRNASETRVLDEIRRLNEDKTIHGIIVQLPFDSTASLDPNRIINSVDPSKDVDGLTNVNAGRLANGYLNDGFIACTPKACLELINSTNVNISGKHAVVVGRSKLVGTPMANLLKWMNATVTICHTETHDLDKICRLADILVVAIGKANYIQGDWLKPGAVVIDCGINSIEGSGQQITGDVDFKRAIERASHITPVPGGVGPMTVYMLLSNTFESACLINKV